MQAMLEKLVEWFAPKFTFLEKVDKDKLTTGLGFAQGVIVVVLQAMSDSGWSPTNPASWMAVAFAVSTYVKGWATNKK